MKSRKLIALCAVLVTLLAGSIPCHAEESGGNVVTGGGSTTVGGGVDTTATWNPQTFKLARARAWFRFFAIAFYLRH